MLLTTMLGLAVYLGTETVEAPAAWHRDYVQAHAETCSSDKPLFIVICSGSSDYARMVALGTFLSDSVDRTLQADYVRFMIDTDTPAGKELAGRFDVEEGPYFVILDRSGKWQVYYQSGYLLDSNLTPVLARYRRSKLSATGRPIIEVSQRQTVRLCST